MSGGIDSSMSAILLKEMGYFVHGIYFDFWKYYKNPKSRERDLRNLDILSKQFQIDWEVINLEEKFKEIIIKYFLESLALGQTPNPCVRCNPNIKFHTLISCMRKMNYDNIATGHYAQIVLDTKTNTYEIHKALDDTKDQSYVLCLLSQAMLKKTLLPLGYMKKEKVREKAGDMNLLFMDQEESQDLCFVSNKEYKNFIQEHSLNLIKKGEIINLKNEVIGEHEGLAFYTIGQRKGIMVQSSKPYYVIRKDIKKNQLIVAEHERLGRNFLIASNVNWISGKSLNESKIMDVKIRYKAKPESALVSPMENNAVAVKFNRMIRDITPGQFAVFFKDTQLLGGGMICEREN